MDDAVARHFGLVIAYLLPGFVCLLGVGSICGSVWVWLVGVGIAGPTLSAAAYVMLASIGAGMLASLLRWAVLDSLHHATGLRRPELDESRLSERLDAYHYLVEQHYRYYQFYGNTLIAVIFAFVMWRSSTWSAGWPWGWPDAGLALLITVLAAGSRDALRKYYAGGVLLLGTVPKEVSRDERQAHNQVNIGHARSTANGPTVGRRQTRSERRRRQTAGCRKGQAGKVAARSERDPDGPG